jgi:hypothetical protein
MSMELTEQQQHALDSRDEDPPRIIDPRTKDCYVLVRADVFDRLKAMLYDDEALSDDEKRRQLAASGERAGWADPEMDVYDNYDENRKKLWP